MQQIARRKVAVAASIRVTLSTALARANAERVFAYVRGACMLGRTCAPVSNLLSFSAA